MFEAVGENYWPIFFQQIKNLLKPNGAAALQVITINDEYFQNYRRYPDFIQKYIFPGGMLPSISSLEEPISNAGLKLISVKGVGSKVAITILSSITIGDIIESVSSNNHNIIKQVPGIGDKTAKLILIQLQGQLDNISMKNTSVDLDVQLEATKAVEALGYQNEEIRKIINSLNNSNLQNLDTESLIRIIIEKISLQNQS